jgi:MFS transporter, PHS family, inorganic phosphate transporter
MLASVFYMQPVGQMLANIVAIIATALSHPYVSVDADPSNCVGDCMETTDKIWRWIVGLGAVVPALTLVARLFIPESPRYLLEVEKDSHTAQQNAKKYFTNPTDPFQQPDQDDQGSNHFEGTDEPPFPEDAQVDEFAAQGGLIAMENVPRRQDEVLGDGQPVCFTIDGAAASRRGDPDAIEAHRHPFTDHLMPGNPGTVEATPDGGWTGSSPGSSIGKSDAIVGIHSVVPSVNHKEQCDDDGEQPQLPPSQQLDEPTGVGIDVPGVPQNPEEKPKTRKASWREFWKGFRGFLFKPDSPNVPESEGENIPPQSEGHVEPSGPAAPRRHWTDGNWTDLAGTSLTWLLLDFSFYFLGVNSWKVIAKVWDTPVYKSVYQLVIQFSWRALVSVSVSSMVGGALFIAMAKYRHKLQTYGFLILAAFLIAVGATFVTLLGGRYFAAIIVLYFFTQLFFDLGKYCQVPVNDGHY